MYIKYIKLINSMPIIKLSIEEHQSLTRLLSHPKAMKYRSDLYDTETFDSMEDKVYDAVNNLTVEDF
tara:strand:+ start:921 stop:1121 length:201 start_codon:yes stop_codon:yes gene_type:complete